MQIKKKVIEKVAECLMEADFAVQTPESEDPDYVIATTFQMQGVQMRFEIIHDPKKNMLVFIVFFPEELPMGLDCDIFAVLNEINAESALGHFVFSKSTNKLTFRFAYFLLEKEFNPVKFKENFYNILRGVLENYPLLQKLMSTEGANA